MNVQDLVEKARNHIQKQIVDNTELFMAQAIVMNPEINTLEYYWCSQMCFDGEGNNYQKHWLEKL